jgi:hypothetical protein
VPALFSFSRELDHFVLLALLTLAADFAIAGADFFSFTAVLAAGPSPRVKRTLPLMPLIVIGEPPLPMCAE